MAKTVLVTGASGFIGSALVAELRRRGFRVLGHSKADSDIVTCELAFDEVTHVIHLAGKSFGPDSFTEPRAFYTTNVLGTINVLEFCRRAGATLTFVSSYVYGVPLSLPIAEDHPLRALNPYSHSKILAEEAVQFYQSIFGITASIVRPFNVYGPGQHRRFLIPTLIRQALDPYCRFIDVADMRPKRDYLHVRDMVRLLIATLTNAHGGIYNAGCGQSISVSDLAGAVGALTSEPKPVRVTGEARRDEILDVVADISRAKTDFRWEPEIDLREGLRETIRWMQSVAAQSR